LQRGRDIHARAVKEMVDLETVLGYSAGVGGCGGVHGHFRVFEFVLG
jgi:hypothetical protein